MPKLSPNKVAILAAINKCERRVYSIAKHSGLYLSTSFDEVDGKRIGRGSWRLKYRPRGSATQRWHTLSSDARGSDFEKITREARTKLHALRFDGVDPKEDEKRSSAAVSSITFEAMFNEWLERHAKVKKRSWLNDLRQYNAYLKDALGSRPVAEITRRDVINTLEYIATNSSGIVANRVQALISAVFTWGVSMERAAAHPALRIPKFGQEKARERVLSHPELRAIFTRLTAIVAGEIEGPMTPQMARIIQLLMLTGARRTEVAHSSPAELSNGVWTIPASRMKNKRPHTVPMPSMTAALFEDAIAASQSPAYVFPGKQGKKLEPTSVGHALHRLTAALGIDDVNPHDLRRTMASEMGRLGVPEETISRVLAHAKIGVTARHYNLHSYDPEKLRALELWERRLQAIVNYHQLDLRW